MFCDQDSDSGTFKTIRMPNSELFWEKIILKSTTVCLVPTILGTVLLLGIKLQVILYPLPTPHPRSWGTTFFRYVCPEKLSMLKQQKRIYLIVKVY